MTSYPDLAVLLAITVVAETAIIAWLLWLNTILVHQTRVISDLLEDTAATPLDLPIGKNIHDRRP